MGPERLDRARTVESIAAVPAPGRPPWAGAVLVRYLPRAAGLAAGAAVCGPHTACRARRRSRYREITPLWFRPPWPRSRACRFRPWIRVRSRAKIELGQCTPLSDRALRPTWPAGSYPFRQRLRVYRSCRPRLARQDRRQDPLYRARFTLGERIQRELQLKAPGRNPEHGDLLYIEGGQSADRTMAASL